MSLGRYVSPLNTPDSCNYIMLRKFSLVLKAISHCGDRLWALYWCYWNWACLRWELSWLSIGNSRWLLYPTLSNCLIITQSEVLIDWFYKIMRKQPRTILQFFIYERRTEFRAVYWIMCCVVIVFRCTEITQSNNIFRRVT